MSQSKLNLTSDEVWTLFRMVENHLNMVSTITAETNKRYFDAGEEAHDYIDTLEKIEDKLLRIHDSMCEEEK